MFKYTNLHTLTWNRFDCSGKRDSKGTHCILTNRDRCDLLSIRIYIFLCGSASNICPSAFDIFFTWICSKGEWVLMLNYLRKSFFITSTCRRRNFLKADGIHLFFLSFHFYQINAPQVMCNGKLPSWPFSVLVLCRYWVIFLPCHN